MEITKGENTYSVTDGYEWFWNQFAEGSWEPNTFKIFDTFLSKERNYVDIGAWIGPTVLYASSKAKKVFAFEPDMVAYRHLVQNIKLNSATNVTSYPLAISNEWKNIKFGARNALGDSMSSEIWGGQGYEDVPAISLESVLNLNPNFIKIDIEGGEKFLFDSPSLKYALHEVQPTIHLSLHTPWFRDNVPAFMEAVKKGLDVFPYFYDEKGRAISLDEAFNVNAFTSVVASFRNL